MGTTQADIRGWLKHAKEGGATHMLVVCDTYDHADYPVDVMPGEDVKAAFAKHDGPNMQRVMEVYALHLDLESQLKEHRAYHIEYPAPMAESAVPCSCYPDSVNSACAYHGIRPGAPLESLVQQPVLLPQPIVLPGQPLPAPAPLYDPGATSLNLHKVHELKCDPRPFQAVYQGSKTFEVRVDDRGYQVGDTLHLREYDRETSTYTGRWVSKRVTYLLCGGQYGLPDNLVVMSLV